MRLILILTALLAFQSAAASEFDDMKALADTGDVSAQYKMGVFYDKLAQTSVPNGVLQTDILAPHNLYSFKDHDDEKRKAKASADAWYLKAAEGGHVTSQYILGIQGSTSWLLKAAHGGSTKAQVSTGIMYLSGQEIAANPNEGIKWLSRAAGNGSSAANTILGRIYRDGEHNVSKDLNKAVKYYSEAHNQGDVSASFILGKLYEKGKIRDSKKSKFWYAEHANGLVRSNSTDFSGKIYYQAAQKFGSIAKTSADDKKLFELYKRAAQNRWRGSFVELGKLSESGHGVPRDSTKALMWYEIASARGSSQGKNHSKRLVRKLSSLEVSAAKSMATDCRKSGYSRC